jgi:hypothetical protein
VLELSSLLVSKAKARQSEKTSGTDRNVDLDGDIKETIYAMAVNEFLPRFSSNPKELPLEQQSALYV